MKHILKLGVLTLMLFLPLLQNPAWAEWNTQAQQQEEWNNNQRELTRANDAYYADQIANGRYYHAPVAFFGDAPMSQAAEKLWKRLVKLFSPTANPKLEKNAQLQLEKTMEQVEEYKKILEASNKLLEQITQLRTEAKWQAVAFSDKKRGYTFRNAATQEQAISMAKSDCKSADCKIMTSFTDTCVATIWGMLPNGGNFDYIAQGATENEAKEKGVNACKASGSSQCQSPSAACSGLAYKDLEDAYANFMKMKTTFHLDATALQAR